ncbi:MAG: phasin family protein [Thermoanaerobaculia bacterium]|nr:phasin family protein [Thermoanaerobaculia bacterium]
MAKQKAKKLPEEVRESAGKIWLAGLGALATAEEEGSKLFKNLVKKGEEVEGRGKAELGRFRDLVTEVRGKAGRAFEGSPAGSTTRWRGRWPASACRARTRSRPSRRGSRSSPSWSRS